LTLLKYEDIVRSPGPPELEAFMFTRTRPRTLATLLVLFGALAAPLGLLAQKPGGTKGKTPVTVKTPVFTDLANHPTELPAITNMVALGIIQPVGIGIFNPDAVVTRGDFAVMVQNLFKLTAPTKASTFSDLKPTDPIFTAVQAMAPFMNRQAICFGCMLSTNFSPNVAMSREESSIILVRIMGARKQLQALSDQDLQTFLNATPDAKNWTPSAAPYFAVAIKSGVMPLLAGNSFQPAQKLTRADTAVLLDNVNRQFVNPVQIIPVQPIPVRPPVQPVPTPVQPVRPPVQPPVQPN